ncbi:hypothetical protein [Synechococcus sp. CBW1108]|uniref:hypothetical protein n=1 Tax=Synechococcus sp. CBW1108 TaxID=1353147 RepID=UPI0018CDA0FA|nr:hypothetical protein [Synechococcus sp. CBW1108]QPN70737.1 hypothetical protein H8F27_03580 [Synechococcus sp. CBW1108]
MTSSGATQIVELGLEDLDEVQGGFLVTGAFILAGAALMWGVSMMWKFGNNNWRAKVESRTQLRW